MQTRNGVDIYTGMRVVMRSRGVVYLGVVWTVGDPCEVILDGHLGAPIKVPCDTLLPVCIFGNQPKKELPLQTYMKYVVEEGESFLLSSHPTVNGFGNAFLYGIWKNLNERIFNNKLTLPEMKVTTSSRNLGVYKPKENIIGISKTLNISMRATTDTVGHEMVHQYQIQVDKPKGTPILDYHGATFMRWRRRFADVGLDLSATGTLDGAIDIMESLEESYQETDPFYVVVAFFNKAFGANIAAAYYDTNEVTARQVLIDFGNRVKFGAVYECTNKILKRYVRRGSKRNALYNIQDNVLMAINDSSEPLAGFRHVTLKQIKLYRAGK